MNRVPHRISLAALAGILLAAGGSDPTDPDGDPVTYQWTQGMGPPVGTLTGPRPSFTAPAEVGTVAFDVVATDQSTSSAPVRVVVRAFEDVTRVFFVRPNDDDANPGTRGTPFRTMQAAIEAAKAVSGDVYVAAGTYSESRSSVRRVWKRGLLDSTAATSAL